MQIKYDLKVEGQRFKVGEGQLPAVAGASLGLFLRAGTGALVQGYTPAVTEVDESKYTLQNVGGRQLEETSPVMPRLSCRKQPRFSGHSAYIAGTHAGRRQLQEAREANYDL